MLAVESVQSSVLVRILEDLAKQNHVVHYAPENARDKYMFQAGQQDMLQQLQRLVQREQYASR